MRAIDFSQPEWIETLKLAKRNPQARSKVVVAAQRYVKTLVLKIWGYSRGDIDDVMQEANLGLLQAIDRFEGSRGPFLQYARWWIVARIFAHDAYQHPVSVGVPRGTAHRATWAIRRGEEVKGLSPKTVAALVGVVGSVYTKEVQDWDNTMVKDNTEAIDRAVDLARLLARVPGGELVRESLAGRGLDEQRGGKRGQSRSNIGAKRQVAVAQMRQALGVG